MALALDYLEGRIDGKRLMKMSVGGFNYGQTTSSRLITREEKKSKVEKDGWKRNPFEAMELTEFV